jgi:hypothetical protein
MNEDNEIEPIDQMPIMDDDDARASDRREAMIAAKDFFKRQYRLVIKRKGNILLNLCSCLLANGWGDVIDCESAKEVADKLHVTKQAVTKTVEYFQSNMGIEPMPGQRAKAGRAEMSKARKNQLTPKHAKKTKTKN